MYIKHSSLIYMGMFYSLLLLSPFALLLLRWPSMVDMIADETLGANESLGITNGRA